MSDWSTNFPRVRDDLSTYQSRRYTRISHQKVTVRRPGDPDKGSHLVSRSQAPPRGFAPGRYGFVDSPRGVTGHREIIETTPQTQNRGLAKKEGLAESVVSADLRGSAPRSLVISLRYRDSAGFRSLRNH